jgi:hypothetical protein
MTKAAAEVVQLLLQISQQRTLVLVLHSIEQVDSNSWLVLERLLAHRHEVPLVIIGTFSPQPSSPYATTLSKLVSLADIDLSSTT